MLEQLGCAHRDRLYFLNRLSNAARASLGLRGAGAEALLSGQPLTHLRRLNLRHHYLSEPMAERVRDAFAGTGVEVDLSDRQTADDGDWRFVEVGE